MKTKLPHELKAGDVIYDPREPDAERTPDRVLYVRKPRQSADEIMVRIEYDSRDPRGGVVVRPKWCPWNLPLLVTSPLSVDEATAEFLDAFDAWEAGRYNLTFDDVKQARAALQTSIEYAFSQTCECATEDE